MSNSIDAVKQFYVQRLREYYAARYKTYQTGSELDDPHELGQDNLVSDEARDRLPAAIHEFWDAAIAEGDSYYPAIYKLSVQDQVTYALRITTDGDDGWLVIFDAEGNLLATAQTYIEVIIWADEQILSTINPTNLLKTPLPGIEAAASQTLWGKVDASESNGVEADSVEGDRETPSS
jgi:predicted RNase H-like HicB family nuclease